jgi:hypothetical protein
MTDITRVLVPIDSSNAEAIRVAFGYAKAICERTGTRDVVLLTHTKQQLNHTGLSNILGSTTIKAFNKGPVPLPWEASLRSETMRTMRWSSQQTVIVAYYAESGILDFIDGLRNVAGVVAVPDLPGQGDEWAVRWNVNTHGQKAQSPAQLIDDPVVVRALETLSTVVNLSTGLGRPEDRDMANDIFRILRAKGHPDPSGQVKSWAIRRGWRPEDATDLQVLARKIWALKNKPSLSATYNPHERYERWRGGES